MLHLKSKLLPNQWLTALTLMVATCGFGPAVSNLFAQEETAQSAEQAEALLKAQIEKLAGLDLTELVAELDENWQQYERQLQSVLRTRTQEEKEFLARVVVLVQQERIPKKLVDSAWLWVRNKRPNTRYPFIYFERVLRLEAEKTKFLLPDFDREAYNDRDAMRQRLQGRFNRR